MVTEEFVQLSGVYEKPDFLDKMIKSDAVGEAKYGDATRKPPELLKRFLNAELKTMEKDGNHEHLINAANYCCYLYTVDPQYREEWLTTARKCVETFDATLVIGTDSNKSVTNNVAVKTVFQHLREHILGENALMEY